MCNRHSAFNVILLKGRGCLFLNSSQFPVSKRCFIYSLNKYLLITNYVQGSVLKAKDTKAGCFDWMGSCPLVQD